VTSSRRTVWLVLLVAVTARGLAAAGLGVIPRDGIVYVETARLVAGSDWVAAFAGTQHPLFPLLAGWLGGTEIAATILAVAVGAAGALAVLALGRRFGMPALGVVGAILYAVAPGLVRYQSAPLAEAISVPLALFALNSALAARTCRYAGPVAGLLAGAAFLARPEALLLPLVLAPALVLTRRWLPAFLLLVGFAVVAGPYVGHLSAEAGAFTLSRKKPAARYLAAEGGFDAHMKEKSARTGYERPGAFGAAVETARSLGEASSWVLLVLAIGGSVMLLRPGGDRAAALVLLSLLAVDLALRYRHVHLHGYLGRRHLTFAAALLLVPAARVFLALPRRLSIGALAVLAAVLIGVSVKPRDRQKIPLKVAGEEILAAHGEGARVATWLTPRIAYYARAEDVKLQRRVPELRTGTADPARIREVLTREADWLVVVPGRLNEKTRLALYRAAAGLPSTESGSGPFRVVVFDCQRP
jgi:hypothetical protein